VATAGVRRLAHIARARSLALAPGRLYDSATAEMTGDAGAGAAACAAEQGRAPRNEDGSAPDDVNAAAGLTRDADAVEAYAADAAQPERASAATALGRARAALAVARVRHGPRVSAFVVANFLPLGFALAVLVSLTWPLPGRTVGSGLIADVRAVQAANNAAVFLVSGLTLNLSDFKAATSDWRAPTFGLLAILGVTPMLGFAALRLPLRPHEFAVGLAIFCVVPTTLGVGVALTAAAKGNQALALALTVSTNLLGIATVPYLLRAVLSGTPSAAVISVDPADLAIKLVFTVLVPTAVGVAARRASSRLTAWVGAHRTALSLFSHCNLVCIVWQTLSAASTTLLRQRPGDVFIVIAIAAALHLLMLAAMHVVVAYGLRLPPRERVAVVIMSAQKSAPVAVTVITYITRSGVQQGLLAIPALVGQLTQIFIGSALARNLAKQVQLAEEVQAAPSEEEQQQGAPSEAEAGTAARRIRLPGAGEDKARLS
jgi:sodium/bile acid cotransporter 7